jgi:hypothetical protein
MASQSHKICVADSSSSRHLSQVGPSINPILKRCPFRWQCPVSSLTIHLNWSLFNFNRSFVLLAEGPDISPFSTNVTHKPKFCQGSFSSQCSPRNYMVVSIGKNVIYHTATLHSSLITFFIKTTGWPTFYQGAFLSECLSKNQMVQSVGKNINTTWPQCIQL